MATPVKPNYGSVGDGSVEANYSYSVKKIGDDTVLTVKLWAGPFRGVAAVILTAGLLAAIAGIIIGQLAIFAAGAAMAIGGWVLKGVGAQNSIRFSKDAVTVDGSAYALHHIHGLGKDANGITVTYGTDVITILRPIIDVQLIFNQVALLLGQYGRTVDLPMQVEIQK